METDDDGPVRGRLVILGCLLGLFLLIDDDDGGDDSCPWSGFPPLCCVRPQTAAGRSIDIDSDGAGGACDDDIHGKHRGARFGKRSEAKPRPRLLAFVRSSVLWMLLLMVGLMSRAHARTNHAITPTERTEARTGLCWAGGHMAAGCRRVARLGQSWHGRTLPLPCSVHDPWPCRAVLWLHSPTGHSYHVPPVLWGSVSRSYHDPPGSATMGVTVSTADGHTTLDKCTTTPM